MDYNSINNMLSGLQLNTSQESDNKSRVRFNNIEDDTKNNIEKNTSELNKPSETYNKNIQFSGLSRDMQLNKHNSMNLNIRPDFTKSNKNLNSSTLIKEQNNERLNNFYPMTQCIGYTNNYKNMEKQIEIDNENLRYGQYQKKENININHRMNQRGMMPSTSNFMINQNLNKNNLPPMSMVPVNTKIQISDMFSKKDSSYQSSQNK